MWALSEVTVSPTIESIDSRAGLPRARQLTGKEHSPTHQPTIELKFYWACPCPSEQDPVFPTTNPSLQQAYTSLLASSTRGQTEEARAKILQAERKPHHSKLIKMKRQRVMSQMKGQDKTSEKQLNEVEVGNLPEKIEFKIMIVKMTRISEKEWRRGMKCLPKT